MLLLKLLLVAASVLLSTLAVRRFGHAIGGIVAGMPMIAAPIMGILLLDHGAQDVRAIALATLACVPATILHIVTFAGAARRTGWPLSLLAALLAYALAGALLTRAAFGPAVVSIAAAAAPAAGLWFAAHHTAPATPVHVPRIELVLRIAVAVAMAAVIIVGADTLPATVSGLLLAVPITGSVLPCITLHRYGPAAAVSMTTGFLRGLHGFTAFFLVLYWALAAGQGALAFSLGLAAAMVTTFLLQGR